MRELTWNPEADRRQPRRAGPGPHPLRDRQDARARPARSTSPWHRRRRRRADRLRGRPAAHDHPPARRRVPEGPLAASRPASETDAGRSGPPTSSRRSSASRSSPSATPRCGCGSARARSRIEAGTGDDAQASEAVESTLTGPEIEIAFNPRSCSTAWAPSAPILAPVSFTQASRPAVLSGQAEADGDADTSYRYVLMPVRFAS